MKNYQLYIILLCSLFFSFCKNDDALPTVDLDYPDLAAITNAYALLTPGNYWIYQEYFESDAGEMIPANKFDSVYVEKDTLIDEVVYAKFISSDWGPSRTQFLRVHDENLINIDGEIQFSWANVGALLSSSGAFAGSTINVYMAGERPVQTALGTFNAFKKEYQWNASSPDLFPDCGYIPYEYWVKDIGIIRKEANYSSGCRRVRSELVRYNIN